MYRHDILCIVPLRLYFIAKKVMCVYEGGGGGGGGGYKIEFVFFLNNL